MDRIELEESRVVGLRAKGPRPESGRRDGVKAPPSVGGPALQLLRPDISWTVGQILSDPRSVPDVSGIYGWWFRSLPPGVPGDGTLQSDIGHLLYVGIAPNGPKSSRTVRDRMRNHIQGPVGSSTLRRTLASLLVGHLDLRFGRTAGGRAVISADCERHLTEWLDKEARVSWLVCERPWETERQILVGGPRLPLNIQGSPDPFSKTLSALRAKVLR